MPARAEALAVMVTEAASPVRAEAEAVMPVGAVAAVVPADVLYQAKLPSVPSATFVVVTVKAALPAVPLTMVPI